MKKPFLIGLTLAMSMSLGAPFANAAGSTGVGSPSNATVADDYKKAVMSIEKGDYRKSIRLLSSVLMEQPKNADALNYIGYSHRQLGNFEKAVKFYERALAVDPDHRGANEYLGEAWLGLKDVAKAEQRLAHLFQVCGRNCAEYRQLANAIEAFKTGKPAGSRRWQ